MQLNGSAQLSRPNPQGIPLSTSPCAPFDDHSETVRQELLSEPPLQSLNLLAFHLIPDAD
jgi:hypothetical protein